MLKEKGAGSQLHRPGQQCEELCRFDGRLRSLGPAARWQHPRPDRISGHVCVRSAAGGYLDLVEICSDWMDARAKSTMRPTSKSPKPDCTNGYKWLESECALTRCSWSWYRQTVNLGRFFMQIIWPTPGISESVSNRLEPLAILTLSPIRQLILQNSVTLEFFCPVARYWMCRSRTFSFTHCQYTHGCKLLLK